VASTPGHGCLQQCTSKRCVGFVPATGRDRNGEGDDLFDGKAGTKGTRGHVYVHVRRLFLSCLLGSLPPYLPERCRSNHRAWQVQVMDGITMRPNGVLHMLGLNTEIRRMELLRNVLPSLHYIMAEL
jgi:hypothetical protein